MDDERRDELEAAEVRADATTPAGDDVPSPDDPALDPSLAPHVPGPEYWAGLQRRRRQNMLWVVVGLLVALAVAGGVWVALAASTRGAAKVEGGSSRHRGGPIPSVVASSSGTGSITTSDTTSTSVPVTSTPEATTAVRAALVAFRRDGGLWIATEAGGNPARVTTATAGVFALSPNGRKLAIVEAASMRLVVLDLPTGKPTIVGAATPIRPEWSGDSSTLAFTQPAPDGHSQRVVRVDAAGRQPVTLFAGWRPRFLPESLSIAAAPLAVAGGSTTVALLSDGRVVRSPAKAASQEVCPTDQGVYFAEAGGLVSATGFTPPSIGYVGFDGRAYRSVVATPTGGEHVSFTDLLLSPDGMWLAYAETGDDGYSRVFAIRTAPGARPVALKRHKDAYLLGWSASGREILLVEGNAVTGERQDVTAMLPDGTGWRVVVSGGGL